MKNISKILVAAIVLLTNSVSFALIKNEKTESVKIYGNCDMCKATIEKAGNLKKIAKVDWNKDSKMALLTYDSKKTNQGEILKRIALAGYDSDKFLAPDEAYSKLQNCCQYDRVRKSVAKIEAPKVEVKEDHSMHNHGAMTEKTAEKVETPKIEAKEQQTQEIGVEEKMAISQDKKPLKPVFENYFALKDALVNTDGVTASAKATDLVKSLSAVKMNELAMDVHMVWMKVMKDLGVDAKRIADNKKIDEQRKYFTTLSKNMYPLMKIAKAETPTYYQFCPMANNGKGGNWLSKENEVKNPYYGSEMMNCGKTVETIK